VSAPQYSGETFTIATIEDIWNLPTINQMERCLAEFVDGMMQARRMEEVMMSMIENSTGERPERALEFTLPFTWKDDAAGDLTLRVKDPENEDGEVSMKYTH
jgi:hypothetical protein